MKQKVSIGRILILSAMEKMTCAPYSVISPLANRGNYLLIFRYSSIEAWSWDYNRRDFASLVKV